MPYCVYILTNYNNTVLYTGVTNSLERRIWEHREKVVPGFTKRYNVWKLVYFEDGDDKFGAVEREKQIKAGSRLAKGSLIEKTNPAWRDLYSELFDVSQR